MNRWIAVLWMAVVYTCIAATAMAASVRYDLDRTVDVTDWKHAAWAGEAGPPSMKERRIENAIVAGFAGRGYVFVEDREQADFLVSWRAAAWQDVRLESGPRSPAFGRDFRVAREAMGTLVVTVHEKKTGKVAWHGMVSDALADDPAQADKRTGKAVEKLLKKFPSRPEGR